MCSDQFLVSSTSVVRLEGTMLEGESFLSTKDASARGMEAATAFGGVT